MIKTILIDMDGVIADFEGEFLKRWKATHPEKEAVEYEDRHGLWLIKQYPEEYHEFVHEIYHAPGFYGNLPPIEGAIETLREMETMTDYNFFICTAPMLPKFENCVLEKYEWVKRYLGDEWIKRMIMTKDKTMVQGDILIDDNPEITGSATPQWEHVVYDHPYNRHSNSTRRLTWGNWKEVLGIK